uniref:Uncharacterized protein n=1 Tax=Candidatus Methanogaster sp. ANME-2c ERB4 TaxID=2759911 RepID=A0A7G9YI20_9EURY|nr:hypothetical protein MPIGPLOG_00022 [Methanosarcinales archaeon ANME-2c ERB4]
MDTQSMLKQMCESDINDSDIKAICKSRGFPAKEATSRGVFENFFISTIGIKEVLDSLTYEEVVFLHLLSKMNEEVGIAYFKRLYGCAESTNGYYYGTFTKQYQETFKKVKNNLLRKGVLIGMVQEQRTYTKYTKMERWRFSFPPEFREFLPPLARASKFKEAGDFKREVLRDKLLELAGGGEKPSPLSKSDKKSFTLGINDGDLSIGGEPFRVKRLLDWQQACLHASVKTDAKKQSYQSYQSIDMAPVEAALYTFSQLGEHEWLPADSLAVILNIFTGEDVDHPEQICEAGWEWGCLVKVVADKTAYYRLPDDSLEDAAAPTPEQYLQIAPDGTVVPDLAKIPYTALEVLASVALLDIHNANLRATASIIKIGNALTTVRKEGVFEWLRENSSGFHTAIEIAEKRWGKQIIHECLMVAQVKDLSLKVQIEKSCTGSQLVSLPDDYIAFPCDVLPAIQKIVGASGHVIKKVRNQ